MDKLFMSDVKCLLTIGGCKNIKALQLGPLSDGFEKFLIVINQKDIYFFCFHFSPFMHPGRGDLTDSVSVSTAGKQFDFRLVVFELGRDDV
jgi:hypothetical protein